MEDCPSPKSQCQDAIGVPPLSTDWSMKWISLFSQATIWSMLVISGIAANAALGESIISMHISVVPVQFSLGEGWPSVTPVLPYPGPDHITKQELPAVPKMDPPATVQFSITPVGLLTHYVTALEAHSRMQAPSSKSSEYT